MVRAAAAESGIALDGRLDEAEWSGAQVFDDFRLTDPYTREPAPIAMSARVLATPQALYVGFHAAQPLPARRRARSPRDTQFVDADEVAVILDFGGDGKAAYEFAVSISGSVRDGTVLQQNVYNYDWDTIWYSAVAEDGDGWSAEFELPWSAAPMGRATEGRRRFGIFVGVWLEGSSRYYSFPANDYRSPTFVADMRRFELPAHDASLLAWIPYASSTIDLLDGSHRARAGLDLIWKPDAARQLTATVNPDFGQVESDDLVVNFSAIETFFTEKRPFFTQNQQLFDQPTTLDGRIIHTRRIGAAPDAGPEGQTDVLAAAKYSATHRGWEYGAFAVAEDDSSGAEGRNYLAARLRRIGDGWNAGYLGSLADRPTLDRQATVHSVDAEYSPAPGWALRGQAIVTDPEDPLAAASQTGAGAWIAALYVPGGRLEQNLYASWYDDAYDVNDFGFMTRNDIRTLQSETVWHRREHPPESRVQSSHWRAEADWSSTDAGERLPSSLVLRRQWNSRDGSGLRIAAKAESSGIDDLSTLGGPAFDLPERQFANARFDSRRSERWRWHGALEIMREGFGGTGYLIEINPQHFAQENLNFDLQLRYADRPDWLIWREEIGRVAVHELRQIEASLRANWYPTTRSELRVRLQWVALKARARQSYDIGADGSLLPSPVGAGDFSLGDLAFQARYRYEFKPLSELFVVYSFGGSALADGLVPFGELWSRGIDNPTAQQLVVKLAYRF